MIPFGSGRSRHTSIHLSRPNSLCMTFFGCCVGSFLSPARSSRLQPGDDCLFRKTRHEQPTFEPRIGTQGISIQQIGLGLGRPRMSFFSRCTHWSSRKSRSKTKLQRSYPVPTRELDTKTHPKRNCKRCLKCCAAASASNLPTRKVCWREMQIWLSCSDFRPAPPG
jgi:hypothetical protein